MDANRPRSTLEVPRRHKGANLEAPKPGPIHNHAPALSESDFDRSRYARAEYVPVADTNNDYRRADPASWRNDPPTAAIPSDPIRSSFGRDDRNAPRPTRRGSALEPSRPRPLSTTPSTQRQNPTGQEQSWQQAIDELTGNPDTGPLVRIGIAVIGAAIIASIGTAILGSFFWSLILFFAVAAGKNADDSEGMTPWVRNQLARIHPALGKNPGYMIFLIGLGAFSLLMILRG